MNIIKLILLSTFYFLLSTLKSQQIEWVKVIDWGDIEVVSTIDYSLKNNSYVFSGGYGNSNDAFLVYGMLNQNGDTTYTKLELMNDTIQFATRKIYESQSHTSIIARTVLGSTINFWDETKNVSKFDYQGNLVWRTNYVEAYPETWEPTFTPLADGGAMTSGYIGGGYQDPYMVRIDKDGNKLFENIYNQFMFQVTNDFQLHNDGSFWISGREFPTSGIENTFMMKLDVNGNLIEKDTIPDLFPAYNKNFIDKFNITNDGSIICSYIVQGEFGYIMRLDSNYNEIWRSAIDPEVSHPILLDNGVVFTYGGNHVKLYSYVNGTLLWSYDFPNVDNEKITINDYAFDDSGNVVLTARIHGLGNDEDMYFAKISGMGTPVKRSCTNPPQINTISNTIGATLNDIILTTNTSEHLKYSDILAHYWHFEDGTTARGDSVHKSLPNACPAAFWAMLVIADGVGCTDTLTIDVCTGQVITNPIWPILNSIAEKTKAENSNLRVYPNPFNETLTVVLPHSLRYPLIKNPLTLTNLLGKRVENIDYQIEHTKILINTKTLPNGIYILDIEGVGRSKIIKQ